MARDLCDLSGARAAYFVFNGTAANVLGLSLMLRPYEAVICAETAHLNVDECGAPERLLGSKLLTVPTPDGKLTPDLVTTRLGGRNDEHRAQPRAVCIAQVTELGTCYSLAELRTLGRYAGVTASGCTSTVRGWRTRWPTWTAPWPTSRPRLTCSASVAPRMGQWPRKRCS